ncbi:MAG: hypothetical protein KDK56_08825 [Simkania sp.]|nr:hypothetical protein [Simkania sp.]
MAISGLGGMGKTALALKYGNDYASYYQWVHFVQGDITLGLLKLADALHIPQGNAQERLEWLKSRLDRLDDYLLIFDGVDHPKAFEELENLLPNRGKSLLLTSRMTEEARKLDFEVIRLTPFKPEEAVDYLLLATKNTDKEQAAVLAERLGYLPLALTHAAAYIRKKGFSFKKYLEEFEKYELKLFQDKRLSLKKDEKTILTTWKITMDTIENYHECLLAKEVLNFFSFLGQAPIPLELAENWFKQRFPNDSDLDLTDALGLLHDYSMIGNPVKNTYDVHLVVQTVTNYHLSSSNRKKHIEYTFSTLMGSHSLYNIENPKTWNNFRIFFPHYDSFVRYCTKSKEKLINKFDWRRFLHDIAVALTHEGYLETANEYYDLIPKEVENPTELELFELATRHNDRGVLQSHLQMGDKAAESFREARKLKDQIRECPAGLKINALLNEGIHFAEKGELEKARKCYCSMFDIIKTDPTSSYFPVYWNQMGMLNLKEKKFIEAEECFIIAKRCSKNIDPIDTLLLARVIANLGIALSGQEKFSEAFDQYKTAFQLFKEIFPSNLNHPEIVLLFFNMGVCKFKEGKFDNAEEFLTQSFSAQEGSPLSLDIRLDTMLKIGEINIFKQNWGQAESILNAAMKLVPEQSQFKLLIISNLIMALIKQDKNFRHLLKEMEGTFSTGESFLQIKIDTKKKSPNKT